MEALRKLPLNWLRLSSRYVWLVAIDLVKTEVSAVTYGAAAAVAAASGVLQLQVVV